MISEMDAALDKHRLPERELGLTAMRSTVIQDDLEAYYNRVQEGKFQTVLNEMKIARSGQQFARYCRIDRREPERTVDCGSRILGRYLGPMGGTARRPWVTERGLVTGLQRWQFAAIRCFGSDANSGEEIELREETRQVEQVRAGLSAQAQMEKAGRLASTQAELIGRVVNVAESIRELDDGEERFAKEISLLTQVEQVMGEALHLLKEGRTGAETIAAETEAIELLLQSRRINPKGGGGGGSSPGGGGAGDTDISALALLGTGAERNARTPERTVGQATGATGVSLPAEFRTGLDVFFDALEKRRAIRGREEG